MSEANQMQVAGNHYNATLQHWDWVDFVGLGYLPAQVTKYLTRWRKKNGIQDLEKSHHFLMKFIEKEDERVGLVKTVTETFITENGLDVYEAAALDCLVQHQLGRTDMLRRASAVIQRLIDDAKVAQQAEKPADETL